MESTQQEAPRKLSIIRLFVLLLVVVALVVLGWAMFFHQATWDGQPPVPPSSSSSQTHPSRTANSSTSGTNTSPQHSNTASSPAASSSKPAASSPSNTHAAGPTLAQSKQSTQLSNTGPGNILALFVGVVIIGFTAHGYIRRDARSVR
jgi:cytoskeletal protein RodZ